MADYYQLKNQNIFNPPANTSLGNATNQFNDVYVQNDLVLGNVTVTGSTIVSPKVSTITYPGDDTAADPAGGQTITLTGTGFLVGATVLINNIEVSVVSVVSSTTITFTSPANSTGSYILYVINTDGGTAIAIPGIQYSGTPTWTTAAGSLGSVYETGSFNSTVTATGDAPITYSVASGTLPPGATFNSNGTITGTSELLASPTTYTFTVRATDAELQDTNRTFSLTINPDVVTWVSPANGTTYTTTANSAISNVTLSATSAVGSGITYSANALPDGISLSGNTISGTPTVAANSSSLLTATANTTSESSNITINWTVSVANDIYFEYNTLLIPGASTTFVDDASTNNFAVTINGDTKPNSFNPYTPGYYSNYFDGTGDYLTLPSNQSQFTMGTGDFTIEMWVYITSLAATRTLYDTMNNGDGTGTGRFAMQVTTGGTVQVFTGAGSIFTSGGTLVVGTWAHIAYARSSASGRLFVNGVQVNSTYTDNNNYVVGTTSRPIIGVNAYDNSTNPMLGNISNLRVVKGTAVYTSNFTPSTTPLTAISGTSLLTCQSNRFIDTSTNNFTLTVTGNTAVNSFDPFTPNSSYATYGSGYFDGTGDYLSVADNVALQFGTGNFTIEMWVYLNTVTGVHGFLSKGLNSVGWSIVQSGTTLYFEYAGTNITSSTPLVANKWTHIAVVRSGTGTNQTVIYVDGVSAGTGTVTTNFNDTNALLIGEYRQSGFTINAYVTDVRIVKGTAVYTTTFTPPSAPLTAISGTSLLTLQNNQSVNNSVFLDNSTNNFLVTRNGNTTQGTFSPYGGNWSNYFDGSGDYLTFTGTTGQGFNFGTGDFTVEIWYYMTNNTSNTTYHTFLRQDSTSNGFDFGYRPGATQLVIGCANVGEVTATTTLSLNTWYHLTASRSGTSLKFFVNGTQVGTTATNSFNFSASGVSGIGKNSFNAAYIPYGYISNVRATKQALYTANFTPSTTPLTSTTTTTLLTCQSNRLIDNSTNNFTITKNGDVSVQRFSPFSPSSLTPTSYSGYLDGSGDYLSAANNAAFDFGTGSFTVEFWIYCITAWSSMTNPGVVGKKAGDGTNGWQIYRNGGSSNMNIRMIASNDYPATSGPATGVWEHWAVVRNGTTLTWYRNGATAGSYTGVSGNISDTAPLYIGYTQTWGGSFGAGYLSNIRVVKGTAVYTAAFTPPTSPLTAISGTSLLTLQSPTFIDNSTNNFTLTSTGNIQPIPQNPFGSTSATTEGYSVSTIGGSGYFDGTGDYLSIPYNSAFAFPSNFTVEYWINFSAHGSYAGMVCCMQSGAVTGWQLIFYGTENNIFFEYTGGSLTSSTTMVANQWNHVALVRSGSAVVLYLNGTNVGSATISATLDSVSAPVLIGVERGGSSYTNGYISNVRITKGTAVYTSNFVPPAQPLTAVQNTTLLTNMTSAGIYDASMMNDMETVGDVKLSTAVSKFGGSSMYFDGTGDYLTLLTTSNLQFGTGDFTIELWTYFIARGSSGSCFINNYNNYTSGSLGIFAGHASGNTSKYQVSYNGGSFPSIQSSISIIYNQWSHLALVRSGTTITLYINGVADGTITSASAALNGVGSNWFIGTAGDATANYNVNGYIDDLRITKGYARYTSNFTPPTSAFPLY